MTDKENDQSGVNGVDTPMKVNEADAEVCQSRAEKRKQRDYEKKREKRKQKRAEQKAPSPEPDEEKTKEDPTIPAC